MAPANEADGEELDERNEKAGMRERVKLVESGAKGQN